MLSAWFLEYINYLFPIQGTLFSAYYEVLVFTCNYIFSQILKPSEKKAKYQYAGLNSGRPISHGKDARPS